MCKKMMSITYMLSFFGTFFNLIKCNRSVATHQLYAKPSNSSTHQFTKGGNK